MYLRKIVASIFLFVPLITMADGYYPSNIIYRYNGSSYNTLQFGVRASYPPNITTVGQAIMYIMAATDYKVAVGYPASISAVIILNRPIPPEAIQNNTMPVYQALLLLIGDDSRLVVDTKHKLVTFETIS